MESNKTILEREVVSMADRKRLGKINGVYVDRTKRAIAGFVVSSAMTGGQLMLPFEKVVSIGNTFIMIDQRHDLVQKSSREIPNALAEEFLLTGVTVYSRAGNTLGEVRGFTFEPVHGKITGIDLGGKKKYADDTFMFFAQDMVFVDDGTLTASDQRSGKRRSTKKPATKAKATGARAGSARAGGTRADKVQAKGESQGAAAGKGAEVAGMEVAGGSAGTGAEARSVGASAGAEAEAKPAGASSGAGAKAKPAVAGAGVEAPAEVDADVKEFLLGLELSEDVVAPDNAFHAKKGTKLTEEVINEAAKHDALLLLTLNAVN